MTTNQSEPGAGEGEDEVAVDSPTEDAIEEAGGAAEAAEGTEPTGPGEPDPIAELAQRFAEIVGAESWSADHGLAKIKVTNADWVSAVSTAHQNGMPFLSFLSAIDWSQTVAVGDPLSDENVEERYELIIRLSSLASDDAITLSTDLSKYHPSIDSLVPVLPGADWHEREAAEMFGIEFRGHPNPKKLYLPDAFEGYPLRKSFPLLSREVKPWPGMVDVEGMPESESGPSTENPEATDGAGVEEEGAGDADA